MTCNACGEKPKKCGNCNKDFPRSVIEINNPETLVLLRKVVIPASMGTEEQVPAAIGKYHNVILKYEANKHVYLYSSDGIPTLLEMDVPQEIIDRIDTLEEGVNDLNDDVDDLNDAIDDVEQEIEELKNSPDVVDIVATYADLQSYDTSSLGDKDVIRVLTDETHDDESSYYRWSTTTQTWTFIGATGPYYTKSETDSKIEVNRGLAHILTSEDYNWNSTSSSATAPYDSIALWRLPSGQYQINGNSTKVFTSIAATELAYPNQHMYLINQEPSTNASILVAPYSAATPQTRFTFYVTHVGNGQPSGGTTANGMTMPWRGDIPTVVQDTGASTTDVMSQKAVRDLIFNAPFSPDEKNNIRIGYQAAAYNNSVAIGNQANSGRVNSSAVVIGDNAKASQSISYAIAIGKESNAGGQGSICIGNNTFTPNKGCIMLGAYCGGYPAGDGVMCIGTSNTNYGYNNSQYRLLTGLYDPQNTHDAATKGYVDPSTGTSAPTTSTAGRLGEIRIDTSTNTAYMCVSADSTTSTFIWKQITA